MASRRPKDLAVEFPDDSLVGTAQSRRVLDECLQHGLKVERRTADHLQDLARRGLLVEGLGEVAVARLQLLEEPDVLDGDHRLVGERLEERDLTL